MSFTKNIKNIKNRQNITKILNFQFSNGFKFLIDTEDL